MFRLLKLSPPHGWRAVSWELGIVTLGVLIALGAEQVVETAHWRRQVDSFRQVVNQELAENLGTYEYRIKQNDCVKRRLDELETWLESLQERRPRNLARPIGAPQSLSLDRSVWASRDAILVSHMPMRERMAIGGLYDDFENNEVHRLDERETWLRLGEYDGAVDLTGGDLMRLRGLISRVRFRDQRITFNARLYFREAKALGIVPKEVDGTFPYERSFCTSLYDPR
jgi:hypothetical protein